MMLTFPRGLTHMPRLLEKSNKTKQKQDAVFSLITEK
jgi:hypothetical protein